jgi:signal transduction histidine kinase
MSAGIAHEINNPMTIIDATAAMLEKSFDDKESFLKNIERLKRSSNRVIKIVSSLSKFSRIDSENDDSSIVLVKDIIYETLDLCEAGILHDNIKLDVVIPEYEVKILCNSIQISQVFLNILNNAKDAIQENKIEGKQYYIMIKFEIKDMVKISISNNGPVIPEDFLARIFEPFYTSKDIGAGTGLGLSLSKGIIENHGGSLTVLTTEEETIFNISLPQSTKV